MSSTRITRTFMFEMNVRVESSILKKIITKLSII